MIEIDELSCLGDVAGDVELADGFLFGCFESLVGASVTLAIGHVGGPFTVGAEELK
jgi:hypothetical protein